jgi:hypothetical protein
MAMGLHIYRAAQHHHALPSFLDVVRAGLHQQLPWDSRRRWSLRDMINFQLRSFIDSLEYLDIAKDRAELHPVPKTPS